MASSLDVEYKQNMYLRLQLLYADETTSIIRQVFLKHILTTYQTNVPKYLDAFKKDLEALKPKALKPALFNLLFPRLGVRLNIDEWDISLLTCLIVNCCTHKLIRRGLLKRELKDKPLKEVLSENEESIRDGLTTAQKSILYSSNEIPKLDDLEMPTINHILLRIKKNNKESNSMLTKINTLLRNKIIRCVNLKVKELNLQKYLNELKGEIEDLNSTEIPIFNDSQMQQMFPPNNQIADIMVWDNSLLVAFVVNVCHCVSKATIANITQLRLLRNETIAHKATALINEAEFESIWDKTSNIILSMAKCVFPEKENELEAKLKHLKTDPLDARRAIALLTDLYAKERTEYQQLHDILQTVESSITKKLQQRHEAEMETLRQTNETIHGKIYMLEEEPKIEINVYCGSLVFILKAIETNKEYAERSSDIIRAKIGEGNGDMTTIHAILAKIKDIRQDEKVTVEIQQGPEYDD